MSDSPATLKVNIKGPQELKLSLEISNDKTVLELKEAIAAENNTFPVDSQRLIYSGKILKDDEVLSKYGLKEGHTIHLVKSNKSTTSAAPRAAGAGAGGSAAANVPSSFAAGQQIMGNPLAPLLNAQNAGHLGNFNPFAEMGINPNDPNYMQTMMQNPDVQRSVSSLLQDPEVIDQVIASNPQLQGMPGIREMIQSPFFRQMMSNPEAIRSAMSMAQANSQNFSGINRSASMTDAEREAACDQGSAGIFGDPASFQRMLAESQALFGDNPSFGGANPFGGVNPFAGASPFGGAPAESTPTQSPEERYATQLEQLANMGFSDPARNVRALLASGGRVEGAVEWLLSNM